MDWIRLLAGPLVGAVIGYFTNYIAVKMLFHPRNPVMIGGKKLPFTPGIIPKRKAELGAAIGKAVESELFGADQVKDILLKEDTVNVVADGITSKVEALFLSESPVKEAVGEICGEELYTEKKEALGNLITDKVVEGIGSLDIGELIAVKGGEVIRTQLNSPFIAMFLNDDLIKAMAYPIGNEVMAYVNGEGKEKISEYLGQEMDVLEETPLKAVFSDTKESLPMIHDKVSDLYKGFVSEQADQIVAQFDVAKTIEEKVSAMSNEALEELVLSVMKHELGMIINLGALIGLVIGTINCFI